MSADLPMEPAVSPALCLPLAALLPPLAACAGACAGAGAGDTGRWFGAFAGAAAAGLASASYGVLLQSASPWLRAGVGHTAHGRKALCLCMHCWPETASSIYQMSASAGWSVSQAAGACRQRESRHSRTAPWQISSQRAVAPEWPDALPWSWPWLAEAPPAARQPHGSCWAPDRDLACLQHGLAGLSRGMTR